MIDHTELNIVTDKTGTSEMYMGTNPVFTPMPIPTKKRPKIMVSTDCALALQIGTST